MATIFQWWFFRAQRSKSCHSSLGACRDRWDRPWQLGRLGPNSSLSSTVSFAAHAAAQKLQEERGKRGHQHSWWKHPSFRWEIAWRYNNCNPKVRINLLKSVFESVIYPFLALWNSDQAWIFCSPSFKSFTINLCCFSLWMNSLPFVSVCGSIV